MFDNFNVNLRKNEGFLTSIPCIPIAEYGQSNEPLLNSDLREKTQEHTKNYMAFKPMIALQHGLYLIVGCFLLGKQTLLRATKLTRFGCSTFETGQVWFIFLISSSEVINGRL